MDKKIGFIGLGNMGGAIVIGLIQSKIAKRDQIYAYTHNMDTLRVRVEELGINLSSSIKDILEQSDVIFLAIKPQVIEEILEEIHDYAKPHHIFITMSPGVSLNYTRAFFNFDAKIVRIMPNTPALIGEGMTGFACASTISHEEKQVVKKLLQSFGSVEEVNEELLDAVTAISGSSPAYVDIFIESLADGGVLLGLPRNLAYKFAAQAVIGSAKMILETGNHPSELKDSVCSPGGTTIEAVRQLEKHGFRNAIFEAMIAVDKKSKEMSKNK